MAANWGATRAEQTEPLPCDPLLPAASSRLHRVVSVHAPVELLYRWVCQLSVAPYSYDWIDNRCRPSPRRLVPGSDPLRVGQRFMVILRLAAFERDDHLTLINRRTAVTYATRPTPGGSRLLVRMLFAPPGGRVGAAVLAAPLAAGDLVMMRRQLLNLKRLAERDATAGPDP